MTDILFKSVNRLGHVSCTTESNTRVRRKADEKKIGTNHITDNCIVVIALGAHVSFHVHVP